MSNLILDSLEIRNFRGLKALEIGKLGRVNLIVGKNSVGKTSVLEALRLYAQPALLRTLINIFLERDEIDRPSLHPGPNLEPPKPLPVELLFSGRTDTFLSDADRLEILIGTVGNGLRNLRIWTARDSESENGSDRGTILLFDTQGDIDSLSASDYRASEIDDPPPILSKNNLLPCFYRSARGMNQIGLSSLWDFIALTHLESDVFTILQLVAPDIERLALKPISTRSTTRVPFVSVKGTTAPVPLKSLGDGVNRLFEIALSLVSAKNGFLLIDEVENGLHYSVQGEVWKLIFSVATKLNVQVFATTHSYDCIRAFEAAARENEEEGRVIRLVQKAGKILVAEFDEEELEIAVDGQIEVR